MQDSTGVPAVVDLAAMRNAAGAAGMPREPLGWPFDLVIDPPGSVNFSRLQQAFSKKTSVGNTSRIQGGVEFPPGARTRFSEFAFSFRLSVCPR